MKLTTEEYILLRNEIQDLITRLEDLLDKLPKEK